MQKDISSAVMEKIRRENIKPYAKWLVNIKNYFSWGIFMGSLAMEGISIAVIIYVFQKSEWQFFDYMGQSFLGFIITELPYFWIILVALFIFLALFNLRYTPLGYRFNSGIIIASISLLSIGLGILFLNTGIGKAVENLFEREVFAYKPFIYQKEWAWNRPEKGFLFGIIIEPVKNNLIVVEDINNKQWTVDILHSILSAKLDIGQQIRIVGEKIGDGSFQADYIRSWK